MNVNSRRNAFRSRARLSTQGDFRALLASKVAARSRHFVVYALSNRRRLARLGIIVGKRTVPHAVRRNALKRLVREAFRLRQRELAGLDVLVRIRTQPDRAEAAKSRSDLAAMLAALIK